MHWYEKALDTHDEENGAEKTRDSDRAKFDLLQRIADMYREGMFTESSLNTASTLEGKIRLRFVLSFGNTFPFMILFTMQSSYEARRLQKICANNTFK